MKTDVELLQDAIDFARPFHEATAPGYFDDHVMAVVREVQKHTNDMNVIRAAVCHDLLEDTACTGPELLAALGYAVYWMAESLTDEPGKNRQERKWKTYHKIRRSRMIVLVKLCDRLDNLRRCLRDPKVKYSQMYLKEDATFRSALWDSLEWPDIWAEYFDHIELMERQVERRKYAGPNPGREIFMD
jgi:(p)ppGpp synthase/HD superfamily hydrolase